MFTVLVYVAYESPSATAMIQLCLLSWETYDNKTMIPANK